MTLSERVASDSDVKVYMQDAERVVADWIRSLLEPNFEVFIAVSAYEHLLKHGGLTKTEEICQSIAEKEEVIDYLDLAGRNIGDIKKGNKSWIRQLSILGLAREVDGYLKSLPIQEFEARALKTYKHVIKIATTSPDKKT